MIQFWSRFLKFMPSTCRAKDGLPLLLNEEQHCFLWARWLKLLLPSSGSMGGRGVYEQLWALRAWADPSAFRTISPKCPTNDVLQSPWPWWNSVHFRASKLHRTRWSVWPIGEEGWTLPALTSPTCPDPSPPINHPPSVLLLIPPPPPPHCPLHPSIHLASQQVRLSATKNP